MDAVKIKSVFIKGLKYFGIVLAVILTLIFIAPYVFADKIKEEIKKTANTKLRGELDYADANVSFFKHFPSLTLTLTDFTLNGSAPYQKERLITAKEVSFGINVSSLIISKAISIDEIYLSDSFINVKINKNGIANYNVYISDTTAVQKTNDKELTGLRLERIQIENSKIIYDDQTTKVHLDILGFNYLGKGDLAKELFDLHSKINIANINVIYDNEIYLKNKTIHAELITKVNINSLSFVFEQNNLKINQLLVDLKGNFDFIKDGFNMDFIVQSKNSQLEDLFTALPPKYITWLQKTEIKGETDLQITLKGKYITSQNIAPDLNFEMAIRDGFINYNKSEFPVSNLNLDFRTSLPSLNPELLIVEAKNLSFNVHNDFLKLNLHLAGLTDADVDANLSANIDLEKLNKGLGTPYEIKGALASEAKIKGKYNAAKKLFPITDAHLTLKNGYIKTPYYPNPITNINILTKIENQKGSFYDLKVKITPAEFTFEEKPFNIVANLNNFKDLNYDINAKGTIDVGKIYKVFSEKGLDLDGFIKADLVLKGKQSDAENGNYSKLQNKGILELRNIGITSEYLPKQFIIKEGIFKINQDKMNFQNFLAAYGQSDFRMNGYLQNVFNFATSNGILRGTFTLNSDYINVDEFMSQTEATSTESDTTSEDKNTETSTTNRTGVIIIPKNLDLSFQANAHKVDFNDLRLKKAKGTMKAKNGVLTMQNTGFNIIDCVVIMNAKYEGISPEKALFEYNIKANNFDIKKAYNEISIFRKMANSAEHAEGIISLNYKLKGRLNSNMEAVYPSLIGNGVISIKDVKIKGMKMFDVIGKKTNHSEMENPEINTVKVKSSVKNNIIIIEQFKFKFAGFRPRIEGTTSLDGKLNIKMRLGLPPLGIIGIPITVTGDSENPTIKINQKTEDLEETPDAENPTTPETPVATEKTSVIEKTEDIKNTEVSEKVESLESNGNQGQENIQEATESIGKAVQ